MSLGELKTGYGNRGGNRGSYANVAFQVKDYVFETAGKPSANDYIEAYLLHDVGSLKAEFDAEGVPTTVVKIRYNAQTEKNAKRPSILEYSRGRGNAKAMEIGGLGIASSAEVDSKTGDLVCNWLERYYPKIDSELHFPLPNVVASVRPESEGKDGRKNFQGRYIMNPDAAEAFSGLDDFKAKAASIIDRLADMPGSSGVVVRIIDTEELANGGKDPSASAEFFEAWNSEAQAYEGGASAVEKWLATDLGQQYAGLIEKAEPQNIFHVIPQMRIATGPMSLPSAKLADANGPITDAWKRRNDDSTGYQFQYKDRLSAGYARTHVHVFRMANDTNQWLSGGSHLAEAFPAVQHQSEVITPDLSDDVKEKLLGLATARKAAARAAARGNNAANDENKEPEASSQMNM